MGSCFGKIIKRSRLANLKNLYAMLVFVLTNVCRPDGFRLDDIDRLLMPWLVYNLFDYFFTALGEPQTRELYLANEWVANAIPITQTQEALVTH